MGAMHCFNVSTGGIRHVKDNATYLSTRVSDLVAAHCMRERERFEFDIVARQGRYGREVAQEDEMMMKSGRNCRHSPMPGFLPRIRTTTLC